MSTYKRHPASIALSMFYLGGFSLITQMIFMREMLVVFYGNELSIGTILASWLIGIGVGATVARFSGKLRRVSWMPVLLCVLPGLLLPFQVYGIRIVRRIFNVPFGEFASFNVILWSSLFAFLPTCFCIGFMFPTACEMISAKRDSGTDAGESVSWIYRTEAFGSMLAGVFMTLLLTPYLSPYRIVLFAVVLSFSAAGVLVHGKGARGLVSSVVYILIALFLFYPATLRGLEEKMVEARWRAFGVIGDNLPTRLVASKDSKYQNLAVTELEGQYALYGNGQVMFAFPDKNSYEHNIHFIMAQNPGAKRVLLVGGNPVGEIPELLKYDLIEVVYVEIDPAVGEMVRRIMPEEYDAVMSNPGVKPISRDALKFVKEYKNLFDAVIINAPDPSTAAANRFYTVEFYKSVDNILNKGAFVCTSVMSSARMQSSALDFSSSIYKSLKSVFPEVLVTSETRKIFIAGHDRSENGSPGVTFDREVLYKRSKESGIKAEYFMPEYFLGLDSIEPWKTENTISRLEKAQVNQNTLKKPVAYYYNLLIWSTFSESGLKPFMLSIQKFTSRGFSMIILSLGLVAVLIGVSIRKASPVLKAGWSRWMILMLLVFTGFCGMGLEVVMIFIFQSLYGYVYTRMGWIVAVFMLGLVLGARSGRRFLGSERFTSMTAMLLLEFVFLGTAAFVPRLLDLASTGSLIAEEIELLIHLVVLLTGWVVGAQFPVANAIMVEAGHDVGTSASSADVADHVGAAFGAMAAGVCLVPILGISGACLVMSSCIFAGILFLLSSLAAAK